MAILILGPILTKKNFMFFFFDKKIFSPLKSANYGEKMAIFGHFGHFGAHFGTNWPIFLGKSAKFFRPETFFLGLLCHLFDKKILCFFFEFFSPLKSANYSEKMAIFGHFGHFGAHFGTNWPISLGK